MRLRMKVTCLLLELLIAAKITQNILETILRHCRKTLEAPFNHLSLNDLNASKYKKVTDRHTP